MLQHGGRSGAFHGRSVAQQLSDIRYFAIGGRRAQRNPRLQRKAAFSSLGIQFLLRLCFFTAMSRHTGPFSTADVIPRGKQGVRKTNTAIRRIASARRCGSVRGGRRGHVYRTGLCGPGLRPDGRDPDRQAVLSRFFSAGASTWKAGYNLMKEGWTESQTPGVDPRLPFSCQRVRSLLLFRYRCCAPDPRSRK